MQCQTCQYDLRGIAPPGPCPECGTEFRTTDFTFRPGAATFHCPHCHQAYRGTDAQGLPTPRRFACVSCGASVEADHMPVTGEAAGETPRQPWADRKRRGRISAFFATIGWAMTRPQDLARDLRRGPRDAAIFAGVVLLLASMTYALFTALLLFASPGGPLAGLAFGALYVLFGVAVPLLIVIPLQAFIAHGVLKLTGAVGGTWRETLSCAYFSTGPMIITAVPLCGHYMGVIAWPWSIVALIVMLVSAHRVHPLRATLAGLGPPLILIAASTALLIGAFATLLNAPGPWAPAPTQGQFVAPQSFATTSLSEALGDEYSEGDQPRHVVAIMRDHGLEGAVFLRSAPGVLGNEERSPESTLVAAGTTLADLDAMSQSELDALATRLDSDESFYVVGDYVFCHRGTASVQSPPTSLWLAFLDPRAPAASSGEHVGLRLDGREEQYPPSAGWSEVRLEQNAIRMRLGLPPIPPIEQLPPRPNRRQRNGDQPNGPSGS